MKTTYDAVNAVGTKELLTKSTKELEVMNIDWSKAPEGATHYGIGSDSYYSGFYKIISSDEGFFHDKSQWLKCASWPELTERPQPTLTYTQAMADNGEFPSVGMMVVLRYNHDSKAVTHTGTALYASDKYCILDGECGEHLYRIGDYIYEAITPPITLVHGMGYQFTNIEDNTIHGIYDEDEYSFRGTCVEWCANSCTNIKPLTVEVK